MAIGKPEYVSPFVDAKGFLSSEWKRWIQDLYTAGLAVTAVTARVAAVETLIATADAAITALTTELAADEITGTALAARVAAVETLIAAADGAIIVLRAAVAAAAQSSDTLLVQTNGAANLDQGVLNLIAGANVSLTASSLGAVTVAATGAANRSIAVDGLPISDDYRITVNQPKPITVNGV